MRSKLFIKLLFTQEFLNSNQLFHSLLNLIRIQTRLIPNSRFRNISTFVVIFYTRSGLVQQMQKIRAWHKTSCL